jgi:predicted DNA-binding protein (MmcQ/YjbR family)
MNAEEIRIFALSFPETEECFPFDEVTLVFKVAGKMFLLLALDKHPLRFNAKASAENALELREKYPNSILPGYHMNKTYWNTIICDGSLEYSLYENLILNSYKEVLGGLPKKKREHIMSFPGRHHSGDER